MAIEYNGLVYEVLNGLSTYVFGNILVTTTVILSLILITCWLLRIPISIGAGLNIPITVVCVSYGLIPLAYGGLLVIFFVLMGAVGILRGLDII